VESDFPLNTDFCSPMIDNNNIPVKMLLMRIIAVKEV
jgi:hypothetical protein